MTNGVGEFELSINSLRLPFAFPFIVFLISRSFPRKPAETGEEIFVNLLPREFVFY